jgi:hypothetical protein
MAQRKITVVHLVDGGHRHMLDDGCDQRGRSNQMRQHLERMLNKQILVDGEPINVFRLAEPPPKMPYDMSDKKERQAAAADDFDRRVLMVDGQWRTPSARWLEISKKKRIERDRHENEMAARTESTKQQHVGELLTELLAAQKSAKPEKGYKRAQRDTDAASET